MVAGAFDVRILPDDVVLFFLRSCSEISPDWRGLIQFLICSPRTVAPQFVRVVRMV
jgi:hypothetical protein